MKPLRGPAGAARACLAAALRASERVLPVERALVVDLLGARVRLVEDAQTQTASLRHEGGERYALAVAPAFLERYVEDDADALFVVLHEILHKLFGHAHEQVATRLPPQLANLACDLVVNPAAARLAFPRGAGVLGRYYDALAFPIDLLLAPAQLGQAFEAAGVRAARALDGTLADVAEQAHDPVARGRLLEALALGFRRAGAPDPAAAARLYAAAWLDGESLYEVIGALARMLGTDAAIYEEWLLDTAFLGDHVHDASYEFRGRFRGLRSVPGRGGRAGKKSVRVEARPKFRRYERAFFEAVRAALDRDGRTRAARRATAEDRGVLAVRGRRELPLLAAGAAPLLFPRELEAVAPTEERVHVYVDVSASTAEVQGIVYGLVAHFGGWIGSPVHLFSTCVFDASLPEVKLGRSWTTGGTDFDCVLEHALARRFRRILIVTDGMARLSESRAAAARRARLFVVGVLVSEPGDARVLERLGAEVIEARSLAVRPVVRLRGALERLLP